MQEEQFSRLACDRCYRRKARCDKTLPSCSACMRAGTACSYNARSSMVRREDFESLEKRLRQVVAKNQNLAKELRNARVGHASDSRPSNSVANDVPEDGHGMEVEVDDEADANDNANDNEVAKQVFSLSLNAGGQKQYLGSASGAILANLLGLNGKPDCPGVDNEEPLFRRFATTDETRRGGLEPVKDGLPPEQLARSLLAAYLSHDHLCYPYLHPKKLISTVGYMYSEEGYYENNYFQAFTMDMIFAIATAQVHKFSWQVMPDAETHYDRAISKLGRVLEIGGLAALQSLMLLCQYRMLSISYNTSTSLWHLLGMATRLGHEFGLHREAVYTAPTGLSLTAQEEIKQELDIKRRCFWSLFGMDRVVSNTLGRPMAINLDEIDTEYPSAEDRPEYLPAASPSVEEVLQYPQWPANTAIFVHITWHRVITGKILSSLHNLPRNRMPTAETCDTIRQQLTEELNRWKEGVASLPLTDPSTGKGSNKSTFKSPEWYRLLYYNCILMLHRPINSSHEVPQTTEVLEQIYRASQQSIRSYSILHKTRTINYTWITLHAVFLVGLSHIHALRTHFQNKRRQFKALAEGQTATAEGQLRADPTITEIVSQTRACSTVLVALSERWNTARECHEVFGRLSDAVLADASDFYIGLAQGQRAQAQNTFLDPMYKVNDSLGLDELSGQQFSVPLTDVNNNYQDCFEDLQEFFGNHYGDISVLRPPIDWNFDMEN